MQDGTSNVSTHQALKILKGRERKPQLYLVLLLLLLLLLILFIYLFILVVFVLFCLHIVRCYLCLYVVLFL